MFIDLRDRHLADLDLGINVVRDIPVIHGTTNSMMKKAEETKALNVDDEEDFLRSKDVSRRRSILVSNARTARNHPIVIGRGDGGEAKLRINRLPSPWDRSEYPVRHQGIPSYGRESTYS